MRPHILLVEDDPDDILFFKDAVEEIDWDIDLHICNDGDDAVNYLTKQKEHSNAKTANLILLDLNLPKRSGNELLEMILQVKSARIIPLIVMSTSSDEATINYCYSIGANAYIKKVSNFDALCNNLKNIRTFWFKMAELPTDAI